MAFVSYCDELVPWPDGDDDNTAEGAANKAEEAAVPVEGAAAEDKADDHAGKPMEEKPAEDQATQKADDADDAKNDEIERKPTEETSEPSHGARVRTWKRGCLQPQSPAAKFRRVEG